MNGCNPCVNCFIIGGKFFDILKKGALHEAYGCHSKAHEVLDIFASLLGTSLSAGRLRALANVARSLLGADFTERSLELATAADRLATALSAQYDTNQLTGLSEDSARELARATELVVAITEGLRALESGSIDD